MNKKPTAQRKVEIITTAGEILISEGLNNLTIKNLAFKNGISESAIYRHFKDKQDILLGLVDQFEEDLFRAIDIPMKKQDNSIIQLKEIMQTHMGFAQERKSLLYAITSAAIHIKDDVLRNKVLDVTDRYISRISQILIRAKKDKLLREDIDVVAASFAFWGLIRSSSAHYALTNFTVSPVNKFKTLWNIYLHGIEKNNGGASIC
ncbi:MAG: TetR/AcrR family transcriptional regulator [Candidatus Omnitrophica bacterium]|nr:TetR/AcrR family transcriptional regulator [Candidatus Omnitrophota bacterium]